MYGGGGGFEAGASQFNGAGFMPTQGNAGGGGGSAKKSFDSKQQTLRAVTIKQLFDASANRADDSLVIDGKEITNVTIVGRVLSTQESGLTFGLTIDDGTGQAAVKIWISDDESDTDRQRRAEWRQGVYVRVHGHVSSFGKAQEVIAFNIRPVADFNEVTYHFLQCIFQHVHLVKGGGAALGTGGGAAAPAGGMKQEAAGGYAAPAGGYAAAPAAGYNPNSGLTAVQNDVMTFFNAPEAQQGDAGISIEDVLARSGGRYSLVQVREAVDALQNEGHLYSTIDENHFKSCNAV